MAGYFQPTVKIYPTARVRDGFDETSDHSHSGDQNRGLGSENRGLKKMADFAPPPLRNFKFSDLWKLFGCYHWFTLGDFIGTVVIRFWTIRVFLDRNEEIRFRQFLRFFTSVVVSLIRDFVFPVYVLDYVIYVPAFFPGEWSVRVF